MDDLSDSSRYDRDSVASTDSLHLLANEFRLRHISTPDVTDVELSKRIASLELENERLRIDLENSRVELDAKIAANRSLKDKVTELYVEAQARLQETLKLDHALNNAKSQTAAVENSNKLYQAQIHDLQVGKNSLLAEIETYRELARQKHDVALALTARCEQSDTDYVELSRKLIKERRELRTEVEELGTKVGSRSAPSESPNSFQARLCPDLSSKLEAAEDELRDRRVELNTLERRLLAANVETSSLEVALARRKELASVMETNMGICEMERDEARECLGVVRVRLENTISEKNVLHATLLECKREHGQVEQAVIRLKSQLGEMIARYKSTRSRNAELESRLALLQKVKNENKTLESRALAANGSLLKKLRDSKRKIASLEEQLGRARDGERSLRSRIETDAALQECLRRALEKNKELGERLRLVSMANTLEESIDEGYGDGFARIVVPDLPSPKPLEARVTRSVTHVLADGRNMLDPVATGLENLRRKLATFQYERDARLFDSGQMSPASSGNGARSVA